MLLAAMATSIFTKRLALDNKCSFIYLLIDSMKPERRVSQFFFLSSNSAEMISPPTDESRKKKKKKKETKKNISRKNPQKKPFKRIGIERFVQQCEH